MQKKVSKWISWDPFRWRMYWKYWRNKVMSNKFDRVQTQFKHIFNIFFTINVGISIYFLYFRWYLKKKMLFVLSLVLALKQQFNELINGKSETNRDQKLNLLFLQRHDQSQKFPIRLVKSRQKTLQRHWYLLYWIHYN